MKYKSVLGDGTNVNLDLCHQISNPTDGNNGASTFTAKFSGGHHII
jgi:hypothetical protein